MFIAIIKIGSLVESQNEIEFNDTLYIHKEHTQFNC